MSTNELALLRNEFLNFAEWHSTRSPLYHFLATCVAECSELLGLAVFARSHHMQPALFFACVNSLLRMKPESELARYWPNENGASFNEEDLMSAFREFCFESLPEIQLLMATRLAQSSEVQRATLVVAGLSRISQLTNGQNFHLIEVGCPTGLLLNYDRYSYNFKHSRGTTLLGDSSSPLTLDCELKNQPAFELQLPVAKTKVGIDPHPVDLTDASEAAWSRSFIPADQPAKIAQFNLAVVLMQSAPAKMMRGEAVDLFLEVARQPFSREAICVLQSFTLRQPTPLDRYRFESMLRELSQERDVWRLALEWPEAEHTKLVLDHYQGGDRMSSELVATCRADGSSLQFRQTDH